MRTPSSLIAAAALVPLTAALLAGCTASGVTPLDGCTPIADPGRSSALVSARGALGASPEIDFPVPLHSKELQRSTLVEGTGDRIQVNDQVYFHATILSGVSGETVAATDYSDEGFARAVAGEVANFGVSMTCARVGERLVVTGPAIGILGPDAQANSGMAEDEPLVLVADIIAAFPGKADGSNQLPVDGMPVVTTAVDGTPGLTLPKGDAPSELTTTVLKLGTGPTVEEGDRVVVNFTIWSWPTDGTSPRVLNSTWDDVASIFTADSEQMPRGFLAATLGMSVGSQVMVISPATDEDDARVLVLDLLGILD